MNIWCIKHNRGWCASKRNVKWNETEFNIATICDHFIILPLACEKRKPTCIECLNALNARSQTE